MFKFGKLPSIFQWRQLFRILTKKEKILFVIFFFSFLISFSYIASSFYLKRTEIKPSRGGIFIEGIIGSPRFINPIYAANNDADRDLVELLFSGLMKYDGEGKLVPDLVKNYQIKEEGKIYEFHLKENILWSDGEKLTADDVIFTIKTAQNGDYKSPFRTNWLGVEVEKINDLGIRFRLRNPYFPFLESLSFKIIPKHIWGNFPPQNFPLTIYNLKPIGSGPYKLEEIEQDQLGYISSLTLTRNINYFDQKPYLDKIKFLFFQKEEDLIKAAQQNKIKGFSLLNANNYSSQETDKFQDYHLFWPRYFAVFFNLEKSKILAETQIRKALSYGTNRQEIIEKVFDGQAEIIDSPIIPNFYGYNPPSDVYQFDIEKSKEYLKNAGFEDKNQDGKIEKTLKKELAFQFKKDLKSGSSGEDVKELQKCLARNKEFYPEQEITGYFGSKTKTAVIKFQEKYREEILVPLGITKGTGEVNKNTRLKLNEICFGSQEEVLTLKFSLTTVNQPVLEEVANILKEQWQKLGIELEIKTFDIHALEEEIIKKRNYDALLFGQALSGIADPYPFWHSSQKKDPGLNLTAYQNKEGDKLLENARQALDEKVQKEKLTSFQNIVMKDVPALFLYSPDYLYFLSKEIKGVNIKNITNPSKRFINIENWFMETKRAWK